MRESTSAKTAMAITVASVAGLAACPSGDALPDEDPGAGQRQAGAAAQISERTSGYLETLERGDVEGAGDYWTEDATLLGPGIELDRANILAGMRSVVDADTRVDVLDRRSIEMFVHGDAAYELARAEEVFVGPGAPSADTARNNMFVRWERGSDGAWRFDRVLLSPREEPRRLSGSEAIDQIQAASDSLEAAYLRGDADRIADLVTESAVVSPIGRPDLEGRASIRAALTRAFRSMTVETYRFEVAEAEIFGGTAYDRGTYTWESISEGQPPQRTTGRYHAVRRRGSDGVWRLHRLIENSSPE